MKTMTCSERTSLVIPINSLCVDVFLEMCVYGPLDVHMKKTCLVYRLRTWWEYTRLKRRLKECVFQFIMCTTRRQRRASPLFDMLFAMIKTSVKNGVVTIRQRDDDSDVRNRFDEALQRFSTRIYPVNTHLCVWI
jgi:hypothetical protein